MPVIAPIIAVAASGWAVGTAAAAGWTLFTTITAVSSVVGAVGVITKNKTLMTIGLVGAAVGGIGQWAQSTGAFGAGTAATKVAEVAPPTTLPTAGAAPPVTGATGIVTPPLEDILVTGKRVYPGGAGLIPAAATAAAAGPAIKEEPTAPSDAKPDSKGDATKTEPPQDNGFLGSFKTFAKDNGALLMLGGSTLSSLFEQPAPGSVERTRAETELLAAQALEKKTQLANMQAPLASFTPPAVQGYRGIDPITGRQVQYATRTAADPGLINTVTGAPV